MFLDEVIRSAENYMRIVERDFTDPKVLRSLRALQRVEYDEWIPPLLAYLNRPTQGLGEEEFVPLLEKITMQNWVRRLGRAARLTVYYQLLSAIRDGGDALVVRQIFVNNARNEEFLELLGGEVYKKPFDAAVLLRLEEFDQDESVTLIFGGQVTIEHILPQALKDLYWQERFTEDQHALWLHRLGNLTPLAGRKNYAAQFYAFPAKKKIYDKKLEKISFDLTKEVCREQHWNVDVLKARQDRLIERARRAWCIQ